MIVACSRSVLSLGIVGLLTSVAVAQQRPPPEAERALVATIGADFREQFRRCWRVPDGMDNPIFAPVSIRIELTLDGRVVGSPVVAYPLAHPTHAALAQAALRAVRQCAPLKIAPAYRAVYRRWKVVIVGFDPMDQRAGEAESAAGIPDAALSADRTSR